ncbi:unnamed protein product [Cochlearia groenlandica]
MMGLMNCASSSSSSSSSSLYFPRNKQSVNDVSSPSFSSHNKSILSIEKSVITHQDSNLCLIPKSSEDLKKEIATIEIEILHMERYLLSLYRKSFEEQFSTFSHNLSSITTLPSPSQSSLTLSNHYKSYTNTNFKAFSSSKEGVSCNKSLGELLSSSSNIVDDDHINEILNPNKLSEDIIRCISSVYCTFSRNQTRKSSACFSASSPLSSLSSSSKSNYDDKWSFHCASEDHLLNQSQYQGNVPCGVVIIDDLKVHLDDDSFSYAALMLQKFRSLVQNLETVDPSRMKREEKLAFWINIHNALVMHAYLAYGTQNRARNNSVLKAAYDVGGYRINPFIIQSSILGIRPHYSSQSPLLHTLFSPSRKSKTCHVKHVYALEYPEALAHFAISSGAFTDPMVRVYTADRIFRDLRQAKSEFIRSNVRVHKGTKVLLPKVFKHYVKDMSMDMSKLMETTYDCLTKDARKIVDKCLKENKCKNFEWLPENLSFRYVIAGDLVGGNK